ncbi:hypothetical protein HPB51_012195 [Rhipicephalus microplus]|uniref:PiggyBac transposable element-derived protein domain-containing protein n=1 Tax=Rhipicephalus microplus TaxID=6941 RepID=A0A9J6DGM5_RHIMP|nr:hypothetical protein HPB51_012195 [Rhipicephalus microplus]
MAPARGQLKAAICCRPTPGRLAANSGSASLTTGEARLPATPSFVIEPEMRGGPEQPKRLSSDSRLIESRNKPSVSPLPNPNESNFSADEKSDEEVSGDSSDERDAIQTEVEEAEEEVATSKDAPPVDRTPRNMKRRYTWVKKDFDTEAGSFENNFPLPPAEPLSAVEYFDMYVSRSMLKAVVDESNKYYFQKHGTTLILTVEELISVLGMFFRMGLVNMHRRCNKGFHGSQGGYQLGLGAGVVLHLCSSLPKRDDNLVVADNFFTGPPLVEELSRMRISYIGTICLIPA